MPAEESPRPVSLSFVKAKTRSEAINKMVLPDPLLSLLYDNGPAKDGKAGWVNAIKDQNGGAYRLLFYIIKLDLAEEYTGREAYEVLYGPIGDAPNFPRALYTTTGAINLMRDGLPSERFCRDLLQSKLEIVPLTLGKDLKIKFLREKGCVYICVYDRDGEGIRILDLDKYYEIFDTRELEEIQVRNEDEVIIGDTRFVKPFMIRYSPDSDRKLPKSAANAAFGMLNQPRS
ncbi:MAG: hypothetical protein WBD20_19330 [Pirellulaceae bacterium]